LGSVLDAGCSVCGRNITSTFWVGPFVAREFSKLMRFAWYYYSLSMVELSDTEHREPKSKLLSVM